MDRVQDARSRTGKNQGNLTPQREKIQAKLAVDPYELPEKRLQDNCHLKSPVSYNLEKQLCETNKSNT